MRLKNCGELKKSSIFFHPKSPYYSVCADVVVTNPGGQLLPHTHEMPKPNWDEQPTGTAEDLGTFQNTLMFRPPYWSHDSIKIPDSIINKLKSRLSDIELIDNHKSSYWMNQEYADDRPDQFLNERYDIIVEDIVKNVVSSMNQHTHIHTGHNYMIKVIIYNHIIM